MSVKSKPKVLFLDDETDILDEYEDLLLVHNIGSVTESDPKKALIALFNHPSIELVVTDLRMPMVSGAEFTQIAQNALPLRAIEFIWITGYIDKESLTNSNSPAEILVKPIDPKMLLHIILEKTTNEPT